MSLADRNCHFPDRACIPAVILLFRLLVPPLGSAAELSIIESVPIDFGGVVDDSGTVRLGLNDLIISDPAHLHLGGFASSGVYTISGDPETAVQINILAPESGGLHLRDFITSEGPPPLLSTSLGADGQLDLVIGASLVIDGSATHPGLNQQIAFTISLVYD